MKKIQNIPVIFILIIIFILIKLKKNPYQLLHKNQYLSKIKYLVGYNNGNAFNFYVIYY